MINMLKTIWNNLFNKQPVVVDQEVHPLPVEVKPIEVEDSPPVIVQPPPLPTDPVSYWPFPSAPPHEANKPVKERKKRKLVKREEPVTATPTETKKTPKQIAADRRKAAATKDRNRAKGKK